MHVTLHNRLKALAPGLTSRSVLDKFRSIQMIDVHLPTTDGRTIILSRYTDPEDELKVLLNQLHLTLPLQPRPRLADMPLSSSLPVVQTFSNRPLIFNHL